MFCPTFWNHILHKETIHGENKSLYLDSGVGQYGLKSLDAGGGNTFGNVQFHAGGSVSETIA